MPPRSSDALLRRMPIEGRIAHWKEEVYFETGIAIGLEKPRSEVETGTIAFWSMASYVCVICGLCLAYDDVPIGGGIA